MRAIKKIKYILGLCSVKGCTSKALVDIGIDGKYINYTGCLCEKHYDEFLKLNREEAVHGVSTQEQRKIKIKIDGALLSKSMANYLNNTNE